MGAAATQKAEPVARTLFDAALGPKELAVTQRSANCPQEVRPRPTMITNSRNPARSFRFNV